MIFSFPILVSPDRLSKRSSSPANTETTCNDNDQDTETVCENDADDNEWESCSSDGNESDTAVATEDNVSDIPKPPNRKNKRIYDTLSRLYKSISMQKSSASTKSSSSIKSSSSTKSKLSKKSALQSRPIDSVYIKTETTEKTLSDGTVATVTTNAGENPSNADNQSIIQAAAKVEYIVKSGPKNGQSSSGSNGKPENSSNNTNLNNQQELSNNGTHSVINQPNDYKTKYINRIENIGYSITNDIKEFYCLIPACIYETEILENLLSHIEDHDKQWSGHCHVCGKMVSDTVYPLMLELKHMNDVHLENNSVENNDMDQNEKKPFLKFRRLSGDKLSKVTETTKPTILNQTQLTSKLQTIVLTPEKPAIEIVAVNSLASKPQPQPQFLKISNITSYNPLNVSKTNSTNDSNLNISNVISLHINNEETVCIKPWLPKISTQKLPTFCKKMLCDIGLFSLFKCMGISCLFTTNSADIMLQHLKNHDKHAEQQLEHTSNMVDSFDSTSWLECSYCEEIADSCTWLVKHIQDEHRSSIFQCPYCFYRTCAADNVVVHLKIYHTENARVLVSDDKGKLLNSELTHIYKCREQNVRTLQCGEGKFTLHF